MANPNYVAGRRWEYERAKVWRERGYTVTRASGSKGPYDLIAYHPKEGVVMIQCKVVSTEAEAKRLLKQFEAEAEFTDAYVQVMEVKVKGQKDLWTGGYGHAKD